MTSENFYQAAQLILLRDSLQFCTEELAQSETKTTKISKLGMPELVTEEGTRAAMLHHKKHEAAARVLAIGQDVEDLEMQVNQLHSAAHSAAVSSVHTVAHTAAHSGSNAESTQIVSSGAHGGGVAGGGEEGGDGVKGAERYNQIVEVLTKLGVDLKEIVSTYNLEISATAVEAHKVPPHFSPLPPRPPAPEELASVVTAPTHQKNTLTPCASTEADRAEEEEEENEEEEEIWQAPEDEQEDVA